MKDLKQLQIQLAPVMREAGRMVREASDIVTKDKGSKNDVVTQWDVAVQDYLKKALTALHPDSRFFAEEQKNEALTADDTWVVDPIDGTMNFTRGRRCSAVSVALLRDRVPVLGAVYNPYEDALYEAVKGQGTTLNGLATHCSDTPFDRALVNFGAAPYAPHLHKAGLAMAWRFMTACAAIRRSGSAALDLCDLASARADIFFELSLSPWDFAAAALIATEAGAVFDMPLAGGIDFGKPQAIMAAVPPCFDEAKSLFMTCIQQEGVAQ